MTKTRPSAIETNSAYLYHLDVLLDELQRTVCADLPPGLRQSIVDNTLDTTAARLDIMGRQVLMFEAALRRKVEQSNLTVEEYAAQLRVDQSMYGQLLDRYPALSQVADELVAQQVAFADDFASQFLADWPVTSRRFAGGAAMSDVSFSPERTETHARGRSVITIMIGGRPTFLYKPRDLAVEAKTTELLDRVSGRADSLSGWTLPHYEVRDGYGWVEWVAHEPCQTAEEIATYYRRAGCLIGFGVALGISDLHSGNIIANGSSPVPIDLEAVLQHRERPDSPARGTFRRARVLEWNALATGLLPMWLWKGEDFHGVDLSGLGGVDEQWCSISFSNVEDRNQSSERLERGGVELFPTKNLVRDADGLTQRPWEWIDEISAGYELALDLLMEQPGELESLLSALSVLPARYLAKPTAGYHYAIQASLHPTLMIGPERRRSYLSGVLDVQGPGDDFLAAEVAACMVGDVPRFYGRPAELLVQEAASDMAPIELSTVYYDSGASAALADVDWLSDPNRSQFDLDLIEGSMLALGSADGDIPKPDPTAAPRPFDPTTDTQPAIDAGLQFLLSLRQRWSDHREWYGFRSSPNGYFEFGLVGIDLYSGAAGILDAQRRLIPGSVPPSDFLAIIADAEESFGSSEAPKLGGAYFGLLSAVPPAVVGLGHGPERETARRHIAALFDRFLLLPTHAARSAQFWGPDLLGGRAGALASVSLLFDAGIMDDEQGPRVMRTLVDDLLAEAVAGPGDTLIWQRHGISTSEDLALGGLSHGQIGISLALAMAAALPDLPGDLKDRAAQAAILALRWEMPQLDERTGLFPDHRRSSKSPEGECAWSHGTPGIALALDTIADLLPDEPDVPVFRAQVDPLGAFRSHQQRHGGALNPSLCHGALGTFLIAWKCSGHRDWSMSEELCDLAQSLELGHWLEYEARPNRQRAIDAPGLMVGRAGTVLGWRAMAERNVDLVPLLPTDWMREPVGRPLLRPDA